MSEFAMLGSALGLGVASSLTVCTMACLPFIGSWVLGRGQDAAASSRDATLFLLGRWCAYVVMGGLVGTSLGEWLASSWWQGVGSLLLIWTGWQVLRQGKGACQAGHWHWPPFQLGIVQAMTPCLPLGTLLALCALSGSGWEGAMLAASFGAGTLVSPLLLVVPVVAGAGRSLTEHLQGVLPWIRWVAGGTLVVMGVQHWPWTGT